MKKTGSLVICFVVFFLLGFSVSTEPAMAAGSTLSISNPDEWSVWSWDKTITARWNAVTNASGYYISLRNKSKDTLVIDKEYTTSTSFKISGSMPDESATYHIWVGAVSSEGADSYLSQDQFDFYVSHEPDITNGSASSITSGSARLSMEINLNYGFGITDWGFYVGTSSDVDEMEKYSYGSTDKGTKTAAISGLSPNTKYYYRAYAKNDAGEEYTTAKSFSTLAGTLNKPVITYPADKGTYAAGTSIKMQWNAVSGADGYRYYIKQLSGEPDRENQDEAYLNKWEGSVASSRLYYTLGGSNVKGGYWYKFVVEAYASGTSSSWSTWVYAYIEPGQLEKANVVSPSDTATYSADQAILFDWDAVSGAEGYHWYIKRLSGMPDRTNNNEQGLKLWDGTTSAGTTQCSLSASNAAPGYWYKFVVQAYADGMVSSWSEWIYCYVAEVQLTKPVISTPDNWDSNYSDGDSIAIKWGSVSGATGYRIHIKKLSGHPDTSNANEPSDATWRVDCGTSRSYTLSSAKVDGGYWYKFVVEAYNDSMSSWSKYVYVYVNEQVTLERPEITSPVAQKDYENGNDIRFTWTKVNNATSYRYYVKQLAGEPDYTDNEPAVRTWTGTTGTVGRQYVLEGKNVQPNTWYKFVVKAEAGRYTGSWSRYTYIRIPDREDWIHYVLKGKTVKVEQEAFAGNELMRTFDAGESLLQSIESKAFINCINLISINLPESVSYIADDAFSNCPNLTIHCLSGSYAEQYAILHKIAREVHGVAVVGESVQITVPEWVIPTLDAAQRAVTVSSSTGWTASDDAGWITLSKTSGTNGDSVIISASKNTSKATRTGKVTFVCGNAKAELKVIQNGSASHECELKLSRNYWEPTSSELSREIIVQGVSSYSVSSDSSWLTYTKNNATVTAKVTSSALGSKKKGILTITCDECGASATVTVSINQTLVAVPDGLLVETVDPQTLAVSWKPVAGATYRIERSKNEASGYTQVKTTDVGECSFNDTGLAGGTTYFYRVIACKSVSGSTVVSDASKVAYATTSTSVKLSYTGNFGSLSPYEGNTKANLSTLSWSKNDGAVTYKIAMRDVTESTNGPLVIGSKDNPKAVGNVDNYSISSILQEGRKYRVWVGGYNSLGHLVAQTDSLTFSVLSSTATPTISVSSVSPTKVSNSGYSTINITIKATNAHTITFKFNGLKVQDKWDKDVNTDPQGMMTTWTYDGPTQIENYSYASTIQTFKFYPVPDAAAKQYTFTVEAVGHGGKAVSETKTITLRDRSNVSARRKAAVARAYEWLNYEWELNAALTKHGGGTVAKGTKVYGLPYSLQNGGVVYVPPYNNTYQFLTGTKNKSYKTEVYDKNLVGSVGSSSTGKTTPYYGADCTQLVSDCLLCAGFTGGRSIQSKGTQRSNWAEIEIGDYFLLNYNVVSSNYNHTLIVVDIDGNNYTCIEQTAGVSYQADSDRNGRYQIGTRIKVYNKDTIYTIAGKSHKFCDGYNLYTWSGYDE